VTGVTELFLGHEGGVVQQTGGVNDQMKLAAVP
jgi:hypothetical protein